MALPTEEAVRNAKTSAAGAYYFFETFLKRRAMTFARGFSSFQNQDAIVDAVGVARDHFVQVAAMGPDDPQQYLRYTHTVVKHELIAQHKLQRKSDIPVGELEGSAHSPLAPSAEEIVLSEVESDARRRAAKVVAAIVSQVLDELDPIDSAACKKVLATKSLSEAAKTFKLPRTTLDYRWHTQFLANVTRLLKKLARENSAFDDLCNAAWGLSPSEAARDVSRRINQRRRSRRGPRR